MAVLSVPLSAAKSSSLNAGSSSSVVVVSSIVNPAARLNQDYSKSDVNQISNTTLTVHLRAVHVETIWLPASCRVLLRRPSLKDP